MCVCECACMPVCAFPQRERERKEKAREQIKKRTEIRKGKETVTDRREGETE